MAHRRRRRATMRDVALLAGVSIKTVSRVVNDSPEVSSELTARVRRAIRQLDFVPNNSAAVLRRLDGQSGALGIVLQDLGNSYSAQLFSVLEHSPLLAGRALLAASLDEEPEREHRIVTDMMARGVDALVLMPATTRQDYLRSWVESGLAVVCVDRRPRGLDVDSVTTDNWAGARMATQHLLAQGHRDIAVLSDFTTIDSANDRMSGYLDALGTAKVPVRPDLISVGIRSAADGHQAVVNLLDAGHHVTAILACRNELTAGALQALQERGLHHAIALVGFDDLPLAELLDPPLTVVQQDITGLGEAVADRVVERLGNPGAQTVDLVVPPRLVTRGSGEIPPSR